MHLVVRHTTHRRTLLRTQTAVLQVIYDLLREQLKGYEGGDHSEDRTHGERSAEDPQENPHGFKKCRGVERVCVCAAGLVGHDRPLKKHNSNKNSMENIIYYEQQIQ